MGPGDLQGVVFDMDGTLLDTIEDIADSMNEALRTLGMPPRPAGEYRDLVGDGIDALAMRALPDNRRDAETVRRAVEVMREIYARSWKEKTKPFVRIPEMLEGMAANGVRMSILSNKLDSFTKAMAAYFFPSIPFDDVRGLGPGVPRKPDPAGALLCARTMGVIPARCLFVGDSAVDVKAGLLASMRPVGVLWGYQDRERLEEAGAFALVEDPLDLFAILESLR